MASLKNKKVLKSKDEIPEQFDSVEEEADFYDNHDLSEIMTDLKPLRFEKPVKRQYFRPKSEHSHKTG